MSVLEEARSYVDAGISCIPLALDGSKRPACGSWKPYQDRVPTLAELPSLFDGKVGIGLIAGRVSGGLEILDFETTEAFERWLEVLGQPHLLDRLPIHETPGKHGTPGRHVLFRSGSPEGNQKLAEVLTEDVGAADGTLGRKQPAYRVLIETRGEGGYVVAPGSPLAVHASGRAYSQIAGPPATETPTITARERERLLTAARSLNERPARIHTEPKSAVRRGRAGNGLRPGDDFNTRASWREILEPHGWTEVRDEADGRTLWRRPGKDGPGHSATTGYCRSESGRDLLYVFSTDAAPFDADTAYSRFSAHALLNHGGDHSAAARALAETGYGPRPDATNVPIADHRESSSGASKANADRVAAAGGDHEELAERVDATASLSLPPMGETGTGKRSFRVLRLADLVEGEDPEVEWLVEPYFPREGAGILAGRPNLGKSWMLLDLALECALGGLWLGTFSVAQGRVLYIDEESSETLLRHRVRKLLSAKGVEAVPDLAFLVGQGVNLSDLACIEDLEALLDDFQPDLLILDSLIRVHRADENSSRDMAAVFAVVKRWIRKYRCFALFADHERKPGERSGAADLRLRGSSEKVAFVDTLLSLERADGRLRVVHAKSRFTTPAEPFHVTIEDVGDSGTRVSSVEADGQPDSGGARRRAVAFLRDALSDGDLHARKDLIARAESANVGRNAIDEVLKAPPADLPLIREDVRPSKGRGGASAHYRLATASDRVPVPDPFRGRDGEENAGDGTSPPARAATSASTTEPHHEHVDGRRAP